jgi:hypothetical protein
MKPTKKAGAVAGAVLAGVVAVSIYVGTLVGGSSTSISDVGTVITKTQSLGQCDSKFFCWVCKGNVDLDSVTVVVDETSNRVDAVKLDGCTGHIGQLIVTTSAADGVKVAQATHDLTIDGGSVTCDNKLDTLHQDAVQVLGGSSIHFNGMVLNCGRESESLIDSNFFINTSGASTEVTNDVVCDGCWLGPFTARTTNIQKSTSSGLRNSTICNGKFPKLSFSIGSTATDVVNDGNTVQDC